MRVCVLLFSLLLPLAAQDDLPEGKGKETLENTCTECHGLDKALAKLRTRENWKSVTTLMRSRGATMSDDELNTLVEYLYQNFGTDQAEGGAPSDWQTFTGPAGWTMQLPPTWEFRGSSGSVAFHNPAGTDGIWVVLLTPKPDGKSVREWLKEIDGETVLTPLVSEAWLSWNGLQALKTTHGNDEKTRSENLYFIRGSATFAIICRPNPLNQQILSTFRFTNQK